MRWVVAAIVLFSLYSSGALACSCAREEDGRAGVAQALQKADLVFVGRIESKEKYSVDEVDGVKLEYERTQFYVVQSWKGEKATRVYVESMITCCMCGYVFPETGSFLVYASGPNRDGYYSTSICRRTKPLREATQDIALLDEIVAQAKHTSSQGRPDPKLE
jgi:hypothetical protein